jgi:hypothetical protein
MGELNPDKIDRALIQECERWNDGFNLKESARTVGSIHSGQKVLEQGQRHQVSLVTNCVSARKH